MDQGRLFDPVRASLAEARTAVRRARERAGTAVPVPAPLRGPGSPPVSQPLRTLVGMPRKGRVAPVVPPHGTRARYNSRRYPCRDACCREANARYMTAYRVERDQPAGGAAPGSSVLRPGAAR